jgi:hypothetical protein
LYLIVPVSIFSYSGVTIIHPPEVPATPVSVFVIDYGRHSSLILPDTTGTSLIEYAYGDWDWFALGRNKWYDVFPTLFLPTRGTLGRRSLQVDPDTLALRRVIWCEEIHEVVVDRDDALGLIRRLHGEFEKHRESIYFKSMYALEFVHSDRAFHLFHNCNHELADWLRELDCDIQGPAMNADFKVRRSIGEE